MTETDNSAKEVRLKIDSLSYGPYGIGRDQGRVILVPQTAPGDEVEVKIVEEKKNYAVGELSRLVKPSSVRQAPPCPHFGICGGCPWQHIEYKAQLAAKEKSITDALRRIGKLEHFEMLPILPSPEEYHYRRRIRLHTNGQKKLGFHRAFSHEVVEIDSCLIADPKADQSLSAAREWIKELSTEIRYLQIVVGDLGKKAILVGRAEGDFRAEDDRTCTELLEKHGEIGGLILSGSGWRHFWGHEKTLLQLDSSSWAEVDGDLFMQVNREANHRLVDQVLQWGEFNQQDRLLELFCGGGNLTLPMARLSQEVVAVEWNRRSIKSGEQSSKLNQVENIHWLCSDVSRAVNRMAKRKKRFSKIILNPPRTGAKGLERDLAFLGAEKIFYISCDPTTLARDLSALAKQGYRLTRVQPIDLFPHTFHVETLAELVA